MKENNVVGNSIKGRRLVHEEQPHKCCWGESDRPRPERVNERQSQDVEYFSSFSSCETEMSSFHLAQLGLELYLPVSIHHSIYSLKGTNWLVQLITENNYILASRSILWFSLMWALLCLSMSRFRKSVHKSWTLTRGWARSCYFTSEIWERTRGSLMWPWPVRMEPESSIDQAQVWSSTTWIHP